MQSDDSTPTKVCSKCGRELPETLEFFGKHKLGRHGLRAACKTCESSASRLYQATHPPTDEQIRMRRQLDAIYHAEHREQRSASARSYNATHREERRARDEARRDEISAYQKAYRTAHRKEHAEYEARRRAANPEPHRASNRKYHVSHCAARTAATAAWRAEHPEYAADYLAAHREEYRAHCRNRRSRILGNGGTHTAADVRAQYDRQRGRCYWCGEKVGRHYHVDHVVPIALGGSNGPENLVVACPSCNLRKNGKHPMELGRLC